jgi:hypothetical protein
MFVRPIARNVDAGMLAVRGYNDIEHYEGRGRNERRVMAIDVGC